MSHARFIPFFCLLTLFSCHKDKKSDVPPATNTTTTISGKGTVNLNILTYDSLGDLESDRSGVNVNIYQTALSAVTNAAGNVSFSNVSFGTVLPILQKNWYEGAPHRIELSTTAYSDTIPCARFSAYKLQNLTGFVFSKDSIAISFKLDRPVPAGKRCRVAIMFSGKTVDGNNYATVDTISVTSQIVQKCNVALLPGLKSSLDTLHKTYDFYIGAVPVSYGLYHSNVYDRNVVIGDNPYFTDNIIFTKNW